MQISVFAFSFAIARCFPFAPYIQASRIFGVAGAGFVSRVAISAYAKLASLAREFADRHRVSALSHLEQEVHVLFFSTEGALPDEVVQGHRFLYLFISQQQPLVHGADIRSRCLFLSVSTSLEMNWGFKRLTRARQTATPPLPFPPPRQQRLRRAGRSN